jgi:hypothetical protein
MVGDDGGNNGGLLFKILGLLFDNPGAGEAAEAAEEEKVKPG